MPITGHTVYILGAGFSADANIPTLHNFLIRSGDLADQAASRDETLKILGEAIAIIRTCEYALRAATALLAPDPYNLEMLASVADMFGEEEIPGIEHPHVSDTGITGADLRAALAVIFAVGTFRLGGILAPNDKFLGGYRGALTPDIRPEKAKVFIDTMRSGYNNLSSYHKFALALAFETPIQHRLALRYPIEKEAYTIISFNYDLLLERAFTDLGIGVDYGSGISTPEYFSGRGGLSSIKLLKLHGSINWHAKEDGEIQALPLINRNKGLGIQCLLTDDMINISRKIDKRNYPASFSSWEFVPPTWKKNPEGPIGSVWREALKAIRDANEIVFIGYSMPQTDTYIQHLLAAGLIGNHKISKVKAYCGNDDSTRQRYATVFHGLNARGYFEWIGQPFEHHIRELKVL